MLTWRSFALALGAASLAWSGAAAAEDWFLGAWKIDHAATAPWASPGQTPGRAERERLLGQEIVFAPDAISGPSPFACKGPHYHLSDFSADRLFEGAFGEMQAKNKAADPADLARIVGFSTARIPTLETGCEIDFHFIDHTTAEFALNDVIYSMRRQ